MTGNATSLNARYNNQTRTLKEAKEILQRAADAMKNMSIYVPNDVWLKNSGTYHDAMNLLNSSRLRDIY